MGLAAILMLSSVFLSAAYVITLAFVPSFLDAMFNAVGAVAAMPFAVIALGGIFGTVATSIYENQGRFRSEKEKLAYKEAIALQKKDHKIQKQTEKEKTEFLYEINQLENNFESDIEKINITPMKEPLIDKSESIEKNKTYKYLANLKTENNKEDLNKLNNPNSEKGN